MSNTKNYTNDMEFEQIRKFAQNEAKNYKKILQDKYPAIEFKVLSHTFPLLFGTTKKDVKEVITSSIEVVFKEEYQTKLEEYLRNYKFCPCAGGADKGFSCFVAYFSEKDGIKAN